MNCRARIYYFKKLNKNNTKRVAYTMSERGWTKGEIDYSHEEIISTGKVDPNYDFCDGKISGTISAEGEPYMGGECPVLKIEYKCSKCKNTHYKHLPTEYTINTWFNEWLNKNE